jgi:hypothetical protein
MKWITRERPKIDRIAFPWLIVPFIEQILGRLSLNEFCFCRSLLLSRCIPY